MKSAWGLCFGFLLATGQPNWAAGNDWQWVHVAPMATSQGWEVLQGTTDVKITGKNFTATLVYARPGISYRFNLTGTITGNRVVAQEVQPETDMGTVTYQGTIRKEPDVTGTKMAERIVLQNGRWFIGLYRLPTSTR